MDARQVYPQADVAALASAVQHGDRRRIAELVASGVDPNARGDKGINLLQWAILHQNREGLDALLKAGADAAVQDESGSTAMHFAAGTTDPGFMATLIANGAPLDARNGAGESALCAALLGGRDPQFEQLVAAGADVDAADLRNNTPLHVAGQVNNMRAVLVLLEKGANPQAINYLGADFMRYIDVTPAHFRTAEAAAEYNAIVHWLTDKGFLAPA